MQVHNDPVKVSASVSLKARAHRWSSNEPFHRKETFLLRRHVETVL